jgi:hypothetical protein
MEKIKEKQELKEIKEKLDKLKPFSYYVKKNVENNIYYDFKVLEYKWYEKWFGIV